MNYEGTDVEKVLSRDDPYAHHLKKVAFENRMDRISELQKKANTSEDFQRARTLRDQTLRLVGKYSNKEFRS